MNKLIGIALLASTAISTAAYAEESDSIIVTARKTEENLKDVPVSVRVVDAEELRARSAVTTNDIPGFSSRSAIINTETLQIAMHGQVQTSSDMSIDGAVGVYVDGVYYARTFGMNGTLLDVKNVQVLYGPQGTLFGRNSTGGAVLINTNDPQLNTLGGNAEVSYGRFNELQTTGVVNVPVSDTIAVRLAGTRFTRDGWAKDSVRGTDLNNKNRYAVRGKVLYEPFAGVNTVVSVERYKSTSLDGKQLLLEAVLPAPVNGSLTPRSSYSTSFQPTSDTSYTNISSVTNIGDFKLTGGWRRTKVAQAIDYDGYAAPNARTLSDVNIAQWTAEAQYNGQIGDNLKYVAGAFYFKEYGYDNLLPDFNFGSFMGVNWRYSGTNQSYGAFGNASYDIGPVTVNGGIRYTHDAKDAVTNNYVLTQGTLAPRACTYRTAVFANKCEVTYSEKFNKVSWTAGLDYHIDDSNMVYAKVSTGYRSGGLNPRGWDSATAVAFSPETITEYQVGIKGELPRVTYSIAGFYNESNDVQISSVLFSPYPSNIVRNAAKIHAWGGEATVSAKVTDRLRVTLNGLLVNPTYDKFIDARTGANLTDSRFNMTIRKQFTADVKYDLTNRLTLYTNYVWTDKTPQSNTPLSSFAASFGPVAAQKIFDAHTTAANNMLNLRAEYKVNENLDFSVWGRNVLDERVIRSAIILGPPLVTGEFNDPVTYGATIRARF